MNKRTDNRLEIYDDFFAASRDIQKVLISTQKVTLEHIKGEKDRDAMLMEEYNQLNTIVDQLNATVKMLPHTTNLTKYKPTKKKVSVTDYIKKTDITLFLFIAMLIINLLEWYVRK
jgi:methyl coenzyme M reductase subunit D